MRKGSVRSRAALGATLVVALALVAAGFFVVATLRDGLADTAKLTAQNAASATAAQVGDVPDSEVRNVDGLDGDEPAQVVNADGKVLGASDPLERRPAMADFARPDKHDRPDKSDEDDSDEDSREDVDGDEESKVLTLPVDDDGEVTYDKEDVVGTQEFRVVGVQSFTGDGTPVTVYSGASLGAQREAVSTVTRSMLFGLPVLLIVVAGVTWLVTRRALRPVEGIRQEMSAITASTDLSRRVPEPDSRDEVARLARTTNETLAALEGSVERQRRFVADASHELRSPVASLRTQLEVAAAHPELLDLDGAVEDTVRLQNLAADLLLLARLDAGERPTQARVSLAALVREEVAQRAADPHPVRVEGALADGEVRGSKGQLARVLGNLLDNAQRHAGSEVRVSVMAEGGGLALVVADDGEGVPEGERERIFERFVRLDGARSRDEGGAGLGLAIARDVAVRHGGSLTEEGASGAGARFVLRLPLAAEG
ncbi:MULTISPECIES: HAMP domain-containing sensor histidine kinase [unclassified Streptomyces]|uniref:sensor histidine kinase n=1 Tax=unclassified Streptomyces TaxID=2593676 RepID=UPI002DD8CC50|nr:MULTISPECIES: HAMP domain-containing sensor histidine kinase [unclassified Streptomyces]WSA92292.1 HAMP domain-containing histidine kinase [Streptomyces sp. NBC_01795]WSS15052.1 HAMP domain-containing histidine kinase [Streptomyces sp. NBC_01186]WSS43895.1 HAMP domain-containing histidine kinase [Streptomyces sp. NBC_01187]